MRGAAFLILVILLLAGCMGAQPVQTATRANVTAAPTPVMPLANGSKPMEALVAPTFTLGGALAKGGPVYGDGEPSIAAAPDGSLYVSFPGCDSGLGPGLLVGMSNCPVGPVYKSVDQGKSWTRLNDAKTGKLSPDNPGANGDADVAVDSAGTVYVSNLGAGIETERSDDGGKTWTYTGNVVPKDSNSVDRNWLAAAGPGHVVESWMGGPQNQERDVGVRVTLDGGRTWSNVTYVGKQIGWEGHPMFAPDGMTVYIPLTMPNSPAASVTGLVKTPTDCKLQVAKSVDGGFNWTLLETNVTVPLSANSFHFSCVLMAPDLAVTGDGHVVWVWSEEVPAPGGVANTGAVIKLISSADGGLTWTKPFVLSQTPSAIFPWATGGAGDRLAVTYLADNLPGDPDRTGMWDLRAAIIDLGKDAPKVVDSVVDANVHAGGICAQGGACFETASDRALLDYFESCMTPEGRLAIVYPADPLAGGKTIEIRTAVQSGGSYLLAAPTGNATAPSHA